MDNFDRENVNNLYLLCPRTLIYCAFILRLMRFLYFILFKRLFFLGGGLTVPPLGLDGVG